MQIKRQNHVMDEKKSLNTPYCAFKKGVTPFLKAQYVVFREPSFHSYVVLVQQCYAHSECSFHSYHNLLF